VSPALAKVLAKIRDADLPQFAGVELSSADIRGGGFGESPLHVVAIWGDVESACILIEEGAPLDLPGEHGCTPLHEAALLGHVDVVRLLLSKGADPKLKCEYGDFSEIAARSEDPSLRALAMS
jgi:ankyrin repeat protein